MNEIKVTKSAKVALHHDENGVQSFVVPEGFELPGSEITIRKDGNRLIVEPVAVDAPDPQSWAEFFDTLEPVDTDWPDIDSDLPPLDDVKL